MLSFFDFPVRGIQGEPDLLGPLRGRVVPLAETTSTCSSPQDNSAPFDRAL